MNASIKTLIATVVATAAAAVMTFAHAYAPDRGEPMATLAAEQALNGFLQAAYDRNFAYNGEPIPTVEAEVALQGFISAAHDRLFQWNGEPIATIEAELALNEFMLVAQANQAKVIDPANIKTVSFQAAGDEPVADKAAGDALNAFVNQMNNNCQPGDEKFGCVIDPTKPSPLPGKSLWAQ